ncbi:MAG: hypothetical protein ABIP55_04595 [Tepidisphaeraceae bacterium]
MPRRFLILTALLGLVAAPALSLAQDAPPAPPAPQDAPPPPPQTQERGDRGDRGGRPNFDPAQFRERFINDLKERLGASDEEFKVIQPKLEKVMEVRRDSMGGGGGFGGFGGRGGGRDRGGDDANRQRSPVEQASRDLRDLLENKDAPADQIAAKLTALREARVKAREGLQTAQKDLKDILTARQEAVLVTMGMLE